MLDRLRHVRLTAVALALYALTALAVGFAHRPLAQAGGELAAIALQADAPFSLCDHDGAPAPHHVASHGCDACALTSAPGLPPANLCALPQRHALKLALGLENHALLAPLAPPAPTSRGPPAA